MNKEENILYLQKLRDRIKYLRKLNGMKQTDFTIEERTIRRIESTTENYNPSFLVLVELAKSFNITVSELLDF